MKKKYNLNNNSEFNIYYKSENMQNTDLNNYKNMNQIVPYSFIGFTGNMFLNPQEIVLEPKEIDNLK